MIKFLLENISNENKAIIFLKKELEQKQTRIQKKLILEEIEYHKGKQYAFGEVLKELTKGEEEKKWGK